MTCEERNLEQACDELAEALRERDYFQSHLKDWYTVRISGAGASMEFTRGVDAEKLVVEATMEACAKCVDEKVATARNSLKSVQGLTTA